MDLKDILLSLLEEDKDRMFWVYECIQSGQFLLGPTDFKNFIIGFDIYSPTYVFVWTAESCPISIYAEVLDTLESCFNEEFNIIFCKPEFGAFFQGRGTNHKLSQRRRGSIIVQTCHEIAQTFTWNESGKICPCNGEDLTIIMAILKELEKDALLVNKVNSWADKDILYAIDSQSAYFFKNDQGKTVSFAMMANIAGNNVLLGCLYTFPQFRNHGYASAFIYLLTKKILQERKIPRILTECHSPYHINLKKIGYEASDSLDILKT